MLTAPPGHIAVRIARKSPQRPREADRHPVPGAVARELVALQRGRYHRMGLSKCIAYVEIVPGAGLEPAWPRGRRILSPLRIPFRHPGGGTSLPGQKSPAYAGLLAFWRPRSELNRRTRICSPLHNHSATRPDDVPQSITPAAAIARWQTAQKTKPRVRGLVNRLHNEAQTLKLERETRLELATPTLARSCSTN